MGSNAMACLMAELSAPLLRRFNLFQVDTRILAGGGQKKKNADVAQCQETIVSWLMCGYSHAALVERSEDAAFI